MSTAPRPIAAGHDLITMAQGAVAAAEALQSDATALVRDRVSVGGRIVSRAFDREQRAAHGLAWLATYVEAIRQLTAYAERLRGAGGLGEIEELTVRIGLGEYLAQIVGGIPMSQVEMVRLADFGLSAAAVAARVTPDVEATDAAAIDAAGPGADAPQATGGCACRAAVRDDGAAPTALLLAAPLLLLARRRGRSAT